MKQVLMTWGDKIQDFRLVIEIDDHTKKTYITVEQHVYDVTEDNFLRKEVWIPVDLENAEGTFNRSVMIEAVTLITQFIETNYFPVTPCT